MSTYRSNYVAWNKTPSTSSYISPAKPDTSTKSKYDASSISRPSSRAENKTEPDRSPSSKISSSYRSSSYGASIPRDRSASRDNSNYGSLSSASSKELEKSSSLSVREKYGLQDKATTTSSVRDKYSSNTSTYPGRTDVTSRLKSTLEKKDAPPVSYRTLSRTGTRSRDPSPAEREKTENYTSRLYPRTYTRSTSREPDPISNSSLKYASRGASTSKEDLTSITARYGSGRSSRPDSKDDILSTSRLRSSSRDELGIASTLSKYSSSRHSSKEDLSVPSNKYITSRFLPKNSVEKSYTAYSKPASSIEDKRKSRDNLLVVLHSRASTKSPVQQTANEEKPVVNKSPVTVPSKTVATTIEKKEIKKKEAEKIKQPPESDMETITVITRGTSPTPPSQSSFVRTRRADMARLLQKDITRPKKNNAETVDKEMQSDRMDDTARYSRFGSSSTVAAAPWSSYLDLKYNTPRSNYSPTSSRYSNGSNYNYKSKEGTSKSEKTDSRSRENSVGLETDISISEKSNSVPDKAISDVSPVVITKPVKTIKKTNSSDRSSSESINSLSKNNSAKSITSKTKSDSTDSKKIPKSKSSSASSLAEGKSKSTTSLSNKTSIEIKSSTPLSSNKTSIENSLESSSPKVTKTGSLSKQNSTAESNKKQLPPQVPKTDAPAKTALGVSNTQNKDFRKSVLNMNIDGKLVKKIIKRSNTTSSDSESSSVATGTESQINDLPSMNSLKLSTSQSLPKIKSSGSLSKLPQRFSPVKTDKELLESRRSPSASSESSSSTVSSSEDDAQRNTKSQNQKKKLQSTNSSRTSMLLSSADELSIDRPAKPPPSPRLKTEAPGPKTEAEAKSFIMRALAPVTNFFKVKSADANEKIVDKLVDNPETVTESFKTDCTSGKEEKTKSKSIKKHKLCPVQSGERAWWLEENSIAPEGVKRYEIEKSKSKSKIKFEKQDSGEDPWWLKDNGDIPDGIKRLANGGNEIEMKDGNYIYKIRRNESGKVEWWLDSSASSNENSKKGSDFAQPYKIRHIDSGEKSWWTNSNENISDIKNTGEVIEEHNKQSLNKLRHQDSGERAWWLMSQPNIPQGVENLNAESSDSDLEDGKHDEPLGDRASPEGLEMPREVETGRLSPYDNVLSTDVPKIKRPMHIPLFISRHTNIDDILGGTNHMLSPLMDRIFSFKKTEEQCKEVDAAQVKIHDSTAQRSVIQPNKVDVVKGFPGSTPGFAKLDDAALQLYKDGDYGSYLDLEASINEQQEEFDGFQTNKKNSIVLRTQLSVRVHTIIEKLLTSEGRELRRALFSLKQIFQEDKDLVHEFVQNDGLACLIKVGSEADQNYQNYILRALGQVMLYVDGMNGVMEHNQTVQWLYTLIASKFRLVVKTALKLLLVFVEYTDSNCMLLIKAVNSVDGSQGLMSWSNIMRLLKDFNSADTELLIYAMTLINKCLNGIPDQDTYYDQTDALEEQGIEGIIQRYMSKQGTDLDLLQQFQIYEAVLQHEDGEDKGMPLRHLDESIRKTLRSRKSVVDNSERRKSRRHSTGNTPISMNNGNKMKFYSLQSNSVDDEDESSSSQSSGPNDHNLNGSYKENNKASDAGVTPALRRRRERAERQRSFMREQQETAAMLRASLGIAEDAENGNYTNTLPQRIANGNLQLSRNSSRKDLTPLMNAVNKLDSSEDGILKKPWVLQMMYGKPVDDSEEKNDEDAENTNENERKMLIQLKRENTVKDITQKLANQNIIHSPSDENNKINRIGDMSGLISKAKEGLAKSKSKADILKSPTSENLPKITEVKKSENELRWEELIHAMSRPLNLCDLDFTDLQSDDEVDILAPAATTNGIPPPPPPLRNDLAPPPPPINNRNNPPPIPTASCFGINLQRPQRLCQEQAKNSASNTIKKNKKTVKLFWKEVRDDPITITKLQKVGGMIWDELNAVSIDTQKLEHLFESRAKDLISKKQQEMNKNKEIIVLDHKRSNAINIGMTKLPPPRSIKTAILKMDATIMNREGIEKLLTMLPTEEERTKIQDAQSVNPDLPLGSAEQFLLTLASISELPARLKLWAFKLDFENLEREIAEPLMDLKQGNELLKANKTFRAILSTLLSIGIFLNGNEVKGFQIEYLAKVPEVKDTVHKHSLLHHLCHIVMEKFPEATDLYSEIGAITRASKIDFDELSLNIQRLESDCKASWDHLKLIAKHDGSTMMKVKMSDFLADCAERIILLGIVHRRVMNRYHKFLLWLGIPLHRVADSKPNEFCRIVSEFSLEYRTTRERVLQQLEKKANHRERNKTRGKMITEVGKFRTKEDRADAELRQLLGSDISDVESMQGTLPWRRQKPIHHNQNTVLGMPNGNMTDDGDDEILESLVKTATKAPTNRATPRERKRTRHADRKSLKRSRTRENNPFGSRDSP